jgi:hypothetical protein
VDHPTTTSTDTPGVQTNVETKNQGKRPNGCYPGEVAHHLIPRQVLNSIDFLTKLSPGSQWRLRYIKNIMCIPLWKHLEIHNVGTPVGERYNPWWLRWLAGRRSYPSEAEFVVQRGIAIDAYGLRGYRYRNPRWNGNLSY